MESRKMVLMNLFAREQTTHRGQEGVRWIVRVAALTCTPSAQLSSVQLSSVAQSCPTLCDPMNRSMPGLPVHHQLPESTRTHVCRVSDAIQPSHPLSFPSPPALNLSQHQGLFQWVNSKKKEDSLWLNSCQALLILFLACTLEQNKSIISNNSRPHP